MNLKEITQLDQILATVATYTHSDRAAKALQETANQTELTAVHTQLTLTAEAHRLLANNVTFTYFDLDQLAALQAKLDQGLMLNAQQLDQINHFLINLRRLKAILHTHQQLAPHLAAFMQST
ncbi:hypothetical protein, partial [Levilactobacillus parabrevis]